MRPWTAVEAGLIGTFLFRHLYFVNLNTRRALEHVLDGTVQNDYKASSAAKKGINH